MHDETEIGLVDSHAERVGRHNHRRLPGHERLLHGAAIFESHPGMVDAHLPTQLRQQLFGDLVAGTARGRIDDSRSARGGQKLKQLRIFPGFVAAAGLEIQIRAREPRHQDFGILQLQQFGHVVAHRRGGGSGQRDRRRITQVPPELAQTRIVRPKIMPPLANAMSFVHGQQANRRLLQCFHERPAPQSLGRHIHQLIRSGCHLRDALMLLGRLQRAVDQGRAHP